MKVRERKREPRLDALFQTWDVMALDPVLPKWLKFPDQYSIEAKCSDYNEDAYRRTALFLRKVKHFLTEDKWCPLCYAFSKEGRKYVQGETYKFSLHAAMRHVSNGKYFPLAIYLNNRWRCKMTGTSRSVADFKQASGDYDNKPSISHLDHDKGTYGSYEGMIKVLDLMIKWADTGPVYGGRLVYGYQHSEAYYRNGGHIPVDSKVPAGADDHLRALFHAAPRVRWATPAERFSGVFGWIPVSAKPSKDEKAKIIAMHGYEAVQFKNASPVRQQPTERTRIRTRVRVRSRN